MIYGSAGGFLSPENLVGRSGTKFPPNAATLAGLFFSANKANSSLAHEELKQNLYIAGPFWANDRERQKFYVPISWHQVISEQGVGTWSLQHQGDKLVWHRNNKDNKRNQDNKDKDFKPDFTWQIITSWGNKISSKAGTAKPPWKMTPILHPQMKPEERNVKDQDGLFLENAVQMREDTCLVYLSTHELEQELNQGWYRFGGENHLVEIHSEPIKLKRVLSLLEEPIQKAFALITPAIWGSNRFSWRYPQHPEFPKPAHILTDKAIPYRHSAGGRLGRGRYAVPAGSVYVLDEPLNMSWWDWPEEWFPNEGYRFKHIGSGLCLPINIEGLSLSKTVV